VKQFASIEKLDTGILYVLELASSLSVLLLAFGLIASMANVLTKGGVLTDNIIMQHIWAWTQCIAIDASVAGTIIRTFRYHHQHERVKTWLYALLSGLLLFTAAIVSNIEAVQQTMNISLDSAYTHVFIPVEALIWIRSVAIVLLIVAHAVRHVQLKEKPILPDGRQGGREKRTPVQPKPTVVNEVVKEEVVQSDQPKALPAPKSVLNDNYDRVKVYMSEHPGASARTVGKALGMSATTANKWMSRVRASQQ
jgi:glucan phosphoethanolaminetransferase (alkaline phosphatase superfamily)